MKKKYLLIGMGSAFFAMATLAGVSSLTSTASELTTQPDSANIDLYRQLDLFGSALERVKAHYVTEKSDKELTKNALNGMMSALDPHSAYLDSDDFRDMRIQTEGKFGGLGIEVTMENGFVKVISPIDDTPASRSGIQAGDYITHLDGESVMGLSLKQAVDQMRGEVGTDINLTLSREDVAEPIVITVKRDIIQITAIRTRFHDNVGYVRITTFNENTHSELEKSIQKIRQQIGDKKLKGVVLDLRNNPGGLLDQAVSVSDDFLTRGEIVSTRGRHPEETQRFNATPGDLIDGRPLIVLINAGSASASEIVAGALQDHDRAVVIGTKSFGKGSVQTIIPLHEGDGAIRLTTALYYTPSGTSIQAKGITPDVIVEPARVESLNDNKMLFSEKDLHGHLENQQSDKQKPVTVKDISTPNKNVNNKNKKEQESDISPKSNKSLNPFTHEDLVKDYQLRYALDLIKGITALNTHRLHPVPTQAESSHPASSAVAEPGTAIQEQPDKKR